MNKDISIKQGIREMFLYEWVKRASDDEIVEKLIQNDERAKIISKAIEYINKNAYSNIINNYDELYNGQIEELVEILKGE